MVRSAVELREQIDEWSDELWLDASARDALGFAVMARVRTERPMPSPATPLTPPLVVRRIMSSGTMPPPLAR